MGRQLLSEMNACEMETLDRADMARLAKGNRAGLNGLMERHAPAVFRLLCGMLGDEGVANDVAEETFAHVYRARSNVAPKEQFRTWLFTVAVNLARQQRRALSCEGRALEKAKLARNVDGCGESAVGGSAPVEQARQRDEAVRAAVEALPGSMREAVVLCEWEEMTVGQAAYVLQSDAGAVESELRAARQFLRERLDGWL